MADISNQYRRPASLKGVLLCAATLVKLAHGDIEKLFGAQMNTLGRTSLSVTLMLIGPPVLLLMWAHLLRPAWQGSEWMALLAALLLGLAGVVSAPWSNRVQAVVATAYILTAVIALPFLDLLAVCSTGDCL